MNANWNLPILTSTYANFLAEMKSRDEDIAIWFDGTTSTNLVNGTKRWNSTGAKFEKWSGTAWSDLSTLYEMKVRDSDKLNGQTATYYAVASHTHAVATTTAIGFMSYSDKAKLDSLDNANITNKIPKIATPTTNAIPKINADGTLANSSITIDSNNNIGSGTQTFNGFGGTGFKNKIINGNKQVNQMGLTTTDYSYNYDMHYKAGNNWYLPIEGINLISGNKYTLSWVGAATASYYIGTATSATINAQSFTAIANGASITPTITAGQNLWIKFASNTTGSTYNFVQFEPGSILSPYEQRPYLLELFFCKWYDQYVPYSVGGGGVDESITISGNNYWTSMAKTRPYAVTMRAKPTITTFNDLGQAGKISVDYNGGTSHTEYLSSIGGNESFLYFSYVSPGGNAKAIRFGYRASALL